MPRTVRTDALRLVEGTRLLRWSEEQNSAQGVAPPPQFIWEKRCALAIDTHSGQERGAAPWRPAHGAAAKKWMQRFRQRWNLTLGRLPAKDILPTATMQAKTHLVRKNQGDNACASDAAGTLQCERAASKLRSTH